jgi:hypothetical protein
MHSSTCAVLLTDAGNVLCVTLELSAPAHSSAKGGSDVGVSHLINTRGLVKSKLGSLETCT